jgi:hypothetical protein
VFNFGASPEKLLAFFRTNVFPYVAGFALSFEAVKKLIFPRVSQIGINYRSSSLSEKGDRASSAGFSVKAGDRMPYFQIEGESVYARLREPKFHVLAFCDGQSEEEPAVLKAIATKYPDSIDFHSIPLYPHIADIFGARQSFKVLLRPDNYIGLISAASSNEDLEKYLGKIFSSGGG